MRIIVLCLLLCSLTIDSKSQVTTKSHSIDQELSISYDNDIIFFTDQYYTSGVNFSYASLLNNNRFYNFFKSRLQDTAKVIIRFNYNHKIFTPSKIKEPDVAKRDRPYAGWQALSTTLQNFPKVNTTNKYSVEIGIVGEKSGMGNFQQWYHKKNGITYPLGWEYQIANEVVLNLGYNRRQGFFASKIIDFSGELDFKLGNGVSSAGLGALTRLGRFNNLNNSAYSDSRLSSRIPLVGNSDTEEVESFLFFGLNADYIFNNIFIEGSLFNDNSLQVEELENGLITQQYGYMYSNYYTTVALTIFRLSPEIVDAKKQHYLRVALYLRF